MRTPYTDYLGRTEPGPGIAGPDHLYVGNLHRDRVVYDTTGRRLKVVDQGEGSTTVSRQRPGRSFQTAEGKTVTIKSSRETITIARGTLVCGTRSADG